MARKKGNIVSAPLFWRLSLIVLVLLCLSQLGVLWLSGERETREAFASGRRLLVELESGKVEGKLFSVEPAPEALPEETPSEKPPEPAGEPTPEETAATPEIALPETAPEAEPVGAIASVPEVEDAPLPPVAPSISAPQVASPTLTEKTDVGALPRIGGDGTKPWKHYSKPYLRKGTQPMIAIIITGLGPAKRLNELAIRLPEPVTLSFSPYTQDLANWVGAARLSGHELLLDLPMEPVNYPASDPGPLGLLVSKEQQENEGRLKKTMARAGGYMGFTMPQDEAFSGNNELFKSLLNVLSGRGLMLVVGKQPHKTDTKEMLDNVSVAHVVADTLIDEELTPTAIQARLSLLEQTAKQRGYAVGIAQAFPLTLQQLAEWSAKLEESGFTLVPVSLIIAQHYS